MGDAHDDGSFDATLTVKFGPTKVTFHARVALELDAAVMVGQVTTRGKDNQGGTRFRACMSFKVAEQAEAPGSMIPIETKVEISNRLAMLVEGAIEVADWQHRPIWTDGHDISMGE